jgi:hypothetical protein
MIMLCPQTYAEYDYEFEKMLQSVEAAVTGDNNDEHDEAAALCLSRAKRLSAGKRSSVRKSILLGGAVIKHEAKKSRGRSMYILPSDEMGSQAGGQGQGCAEQELRHAQEVAMQSLAADDKASLKSRSSAMLSEKVSRRQSRAQSDGTVFVPSEAKQRK